MINLHYNAKLEYKNLNNSINWKLSKLKNIRKVIRRNTLSCWLFQKLTVSYSHFQIKLRIALKTWKEIIAMSLWKQNPQNPRTKYYTTHIFIGLNMVNYSDFILAFRSSLIRRPIQFKFIWLNLLEACLV